MRHQNILVIGGAGFVGRRIIGDLVARGRRVVVPCRRRERAKALLPLPTVDVIEADVLEGDALERLLVGRDAVINLVGILHGSETEFDAVHHQWPARLADAAVAAGIRRIVHVSAMGASEDAPSHYLKSKARGEAALLNRPALDVTIFRPAVIFGPDDQFLMMFAGLARKLPVIPLAGASGRLAPVYVGDVAQVIAGSLDRVATYGQTYVLTGPKAYSMAELVALAARASGHARPVVALGDQASALMARLMRLVPGRPLLSRDNLLSLQVPQSVVTGSNGLGSGDFAQDAVLHPTELETLAAEMLSPQRPKTRFDVFRHSTRS